MPVNSWQESDSWKKDESNAPSRSLVEDLPDFHPSSGEGDRAYPGYAGRRRKAAAVLTVAWSSTIALHLMPGRIWFVVGVTVLFAAQVLRLMLARRVPPFEDSATENSEASLPFVTLLVPAKNEEAVVAKLVKMLCNLDYPACRYEVWVVDDNSTDGTPVLLDELSDRYEQLNVLHRQAGLGGGKSGALNQIWPETQGEIVAVFDADACVPPDVLRRVLPAFRRQAVGAVQMRKSIINARENFWTRGQAAEMALDAYFQEQRMATGGVGELRGNGQFVRRLALERCGGFNEETITDDLDLTTRLHLDRWDIELLRVPAVEEEGVPRFLALWHQRNRWAEGGYQRYLDYWKPIFSGRMGARKTLDFLFFGFVQYLLPVVALPDLFASLWLHRMPVFAPVTGLTVSFSMLGMLLGLRRTRLLAKRSPLSFLTVLLDALQGTLYMLHWFLVVASVAARTSVRPKRLKWVKTARVDR